MSRTCGTCAFPQHNGGTCPFFYEKFPPETAGCPKHTTSLVTCDVCGKLTYEPIIDITDEAELHMWCPDCNSKSGHCQTCNRGGECSFMNDPSPIPKTIRKEIRQGNMIAVTDVMNPERVEKTCKNGCPCLDPEFGCLKQNNCCGKWRPVYEKV